MKSIIEEVKTKCADRSLKTFGKEYVKYFFPLNIGLVFLFLLAPEHDGDMSYGDIRYFGSFAFDLI